MAVSAVLTANLYNGLNTRVRPVFSMRECREQKLTLIRFDRLGIGSYSEVS